ncbi:hypothetical protein ACO0LM_11845 [Undibacterium sp. Di26W]|uniref:hypothetical protein n=1 Tax=Undibacterium sp. Di26W TaxID=3413035 RepID=UPI003BF2A0BA
MMATKAAQIASKIEEKIRGILTTNGFETNIGENVYRGRIHPDGMKLPFTVIGEADDNPTGSTSRGTETRISQRYILEATLNCDRDNPNDAAHQAIGDLKKAIFKDVAKTALQTLGGLAISVAYSGRMISPRPDGTAMVTASITITVDYTENLAEP